MPYINRKITLELEFDIFAENEALQDQEQFAANVKKFIDDWLMVSNTKVLNVQDSLREKEAEK